MSAEYEAYQGFLGTFAQARSTTAGTPDTWYQNGCEPSCAFCRRLHHIVAETTDEGVTTYRPAQPGEDVPDDCTPIVEQWEKHIAIRPLSPVTPLHTLVMPRSHIPNHTFGLALAATMVRAAEVARAFEWSGYDTNLIVSSGKAATQTVSHLHVHVIPRRDGDGLMVPWGTAGDPRAPHDCIVAQRERDVVHELRRQIVPLAKRAGEDHDGAPGEMERLAREAVGGRIEALANQVRRLGGTAP